MSGRFSHRNYIWKKSQKYTKTVLYLWKVMLKKQICKMQFNKDIKQDKEICVLIFKDVSLLRIRLQMDISIHRQIASLEITTVMIFFLQNCSEIVLNAQYLVCIYQPKIAWFLVIFFSVLEPVLKEIDFMFHVSCFMFQA